jgi:hypothetical protein
VNFWQYGNIAWAMTCAYFALQVHLSEARVEHTLRKLGEMESLINDKLLQEKQGSGRAKTLPRATSTMEEVVTGEPEASSAVGVNSSYSRGKALDISGPVAPYPASLKNFWYPVAFSDHIDEKTMVNIAPQLLDMMLPCDEAFSFLAKMLGILLCLGLIL